MVQSRLACNWVVTINNASKYTIRCVNVQGSQWTQSSYDALQPNQVGCFAAPADNEVIDKYYYNALVFTIDNYPGGAKYFVVYVRAYATTWEKTGFDAKLHWDNAVGWIPSSSFNNTSTVPSVTNFNNNVKFLGYWTSQENTAVLSMMFTGDTF